jgi:hypothetical protein
MGVSGASQLDQRELHNIYNRTREEAPDLLASLERRLDELAAEAVTPMTWFAPFQGPGYFCAHCPTGNVSGALGAWLPWGDLLYTNLGVPAGG